MPFKQLPRFSIQAVLLVIGFSILATISMASIVLVRQSSEEAAQVAHTLDVQNQLSNLLLVIRNWSSK